MNENKTLIIWLKNGDTCKFEQVENFEDESSESLRFTYFEVSTQVSRVAIFFKDNIAGYALET